MSNAKSQNSDVPAEHEAAAQSIRRVGARQRTQRRWQVKQQVRINPHIVDPDTLRALSGKQSRSGVRKWAAEQGIRVLDGKNGLWTTAEALNDALEVRAPSDTAYSPEDIA